MQTLEDLILEKFDGKPTHCAKAMGISNKDLYNLMRSNPSVVELKEGGYITVSKYSKFISIPKKKKPKILQDGGLEGLYSDDLPEILKKQAG